MAWTALSFPFGSILTSAKMTQLFDNFAAMASGASGAPAMDIKQGNLNTSSGTVSTTSTTDTAKTLPGGQYGFLPDLYSSNASGESYWGTGISNNLVAYGQGTTPVTTISMRSNNASYTAYIRQLYMNASRPYDLGDGEVRRFIFLEVDSNGKVVGGYDADVAPWHYNGPTNIMACRYDEQGRGYRKLRRTDGLPFTLAEALENEDKFFEFVRAFHMSEEREELITQDIKNADMPLIPHPFPGTEHTTVLLDPVAGLTSQLDEMSADPDFSILDAIHRGYIKVGNSPILRAGPPGVQVVSFDWKRSGGR